MQTKEPINTACPQRFIEQVKGAHQETQKEVRIDIHTAQSHIIQSLYCPAGDYEALMTPISRKKQAKKKL